MDITIQTALDSFPVSPCNDLQENLDHFDWHYEGIKKQKLVFKNQSMDGVQSIEIIKCKPGTYEIILREIDERGYIPAPMPYLLGLGVQNLDVIKKYKWITSLDQNNLLSREDKRQCFLGLSWRNLNALNLVEIRTKFDSTWCFAVLKKGLVETKDLGNTRFLMPAQSDSVPIESTLTKSQDFALQQIKLGKNIFLIGVAGTGKTFLLNALSVLTGRQVFLTASTGSASLQLTNGRTVSSFLGLGKYDQETATFKCPKKLDYSILVIDEISMIGIVQWNYIMKSIKQNCKNIDTVQIIIAGDLWQMPPMFWDQQLFNIYSPKELAELNELIELTGDMFGMNLDPVKCIEPNIPEVDFPIVELTEIVRQDDAEFISKLMDIRYNGLAEHLPWLYKNCGNPDRLGITLVPTRTMMDQMNETVEKGRIHSRYDLLEVDDEDKPYKSLELWKDMKVIIINNNLKKGYVNGDTGKILAFNKKEDEVIIKLDRNSEIVSVSEIKRVYYRPIDSTNEQEESAVEEDYYYYMPLLPAYFLSVRRAQGSTIEYGNIHESFLEDQISRQYTALSRFKSIRNIYIEKPKRKRIFVSKDKILT
jgi:hypothetical protein